MKIVADECVDNGIVARLRKDGHEVSYVAELSPGIMDEEVLVLASEDNTLFVTADKDFGELIFRQGYVKRGIVYIALRVFQPMRKPK